MFDLSWSTTFASNLRCNVNSPGYVMFVQGVHGNTHYFCRWMNELKLSVESNWKGSQNTALPFVILLLETRMIIHILEH